MSVVCNELAGSRTVRIILSDWSRDFVQEVRAAYRRVHAPDLPALQIYADASSHRKGNASLSYIKNPLELLGNRIMSKCAGRDDSMCCSV